MRPTSPAAIAALGGALLAKPFDPPQIEAAIAERLAAGGIVGTEASAPATEP